MPRAKIKIRTVATKSGGLRRLPRDDSSNSLRLIRPGRLAALLDVDPATIWRWAQSGVLPPPVEFSPGVRGWTQQQIEELLEQRQQGAGNAR
jgi:predicted DNA-binding transcriptional regulator AlpA